MKMTQKIDVTDVEIIPAIEPSGHISGVALTAMELLAKGGHRRVYIIFNELPIEVFADDDIDSIVAKYDGLRRSHHYAGHCALRDRS